MDAEGFIGVLWARLGIFIFHPYACIVHSFLLHQPVKLVYNGYFCPLVHSPVKDTSFESLKNVALSFSFYT